jgi:hypothetical protein
VNQLKAVLESLLTAHKKNSKLRIDIELSSGNVLERVAISDLSGDVVTIIMSEEKYYYSLQHIIGFSSSYDDHQ